METDPYEVLHTWLATTPYGHRTREAYEAEVRDWLDHIGGRVWTATKFDVFAWASRHTNVRTRTHYIAAARSFYEHCVELGLLQNNPALAALRGDVRHLPKRETLTKEQAKALIEAADHYRGPHAPRDRAYIYLLLGMDARPGQLADLLINHFHHEQFRVTVDMPQKGGGTRTRPPDEVPAWVWHAIKDYLPHRITKPPLSGDDWGPLLTTRRGAPFKQSRATPGNIVRPILKMHPDLEHLVGTITVDGIAHSPSPW